MSWASAANRRVRKQAVGKLERIHWPVLPWPRLLDAWAAELWSAIQDSVAPLLRDGLETVNSAEQSTGNGGIGVRVASGHHGLHDSFLKG